MPLFRAISITRSRKGVDAPKIRSSALGTVARTCANASRATSNPFRSTNDPWYMITKGLLPLWFVGSYGWGVRNGKIFWSGEFITTAIFSAEQLREEKIRLHAI